MGRTRALGLAAAMLLVAPSANAGPYTDDLSQCLVSSTTEQDKVALVEWIFFSLSLNPKISPYASISLEQRDTADRNIAQLFERLLTETCVDPAKEAVRYEGVAAISQSFQLLGQVAAKEIFKHPAVSAGTEKFTQYIDEERLGKVLGLPAADE